jgi:uncharacterized protein YoxC
MARKLTEILRPKAASAEGEHHDPRALEELVQRRNELAHQLEGVRRETEDLIHQRRVLSEGEVDSLVRSGTSTNADSLADVDRLIQQGRGRIEHLEAAVSRLNTEVDGLRRRVLEQRREDARVAAIAVAVELSAALSSVVALTEHLAHALEAAHSLGAPAAELPIAPDPKIARWIRDMVRLPAGGSK